MNSYEIYRMQCLETDEKKIRECFSKYNCTFSEMYENVSKLLRNKHSKGYEEERFVKVRLNEKYWPERHNPFRVEYFTFFTRLYPNITFRLFTFTNDMQSGYTYIFKGEEYGYEGELEDFSEKNLKKTEKVNIINGFRAYAPENSEVVLDIMEICDNGEICGIADKTLKPYSYCTKYVTDASTFTHFAKFETCDENLIRLRSRVNGI